MRHLWIYAVLLLLIADASSCSAAANCVPSNLLLNSSQEVESFSPFKKVISLRQTSGFERAKIEYLIARIKGSKLIFIRNGEVHTGEEAARHLSYKYIKRLGIIKTVEDFIEKVASESKTSGQPYYIQFPDGHSFPAREIFMNELCELEKHLSPS